MRVLETPNGSQSVYAGWMDPKALMGVTAAAALKVAQVDKCVKAALIQAAKQIMGKM